MEVDQVNHAVVESQKRDIELRENLDDSRPALEDSMPPQDPELGKIIKKLDWNLMPLLFVLYSLSVLDRSNLGNEKLAGLEDDIDLSGNRCNWLGTSFYISC